ncbi:MAG: hypothetical protein ACFFD4_26225 [Candidatus Odinarchaeota archaeon]
MTVGFFIGIRNSFTDEAQDDANAFLAAVTQSLLAAGYSGYSEPPVLPDVYVGYKFGRSALDNIGGFSLGKLAGIGLEKYGVLHLSLIASAPLLVAFLPFDFGEPLETKYTCTDWYGNSEHVWIGSSQGLLRELLELAPDLGIPLNKGVLEDGTTELINDYQPLYKGDTCEMAEDERVAWLVLHEGAKLSIEHGIALALHR